MTVRIAFLFLLLSSFVFPCAAETSPLEEFVWEIVTEELFPHIDQETSSTTRGAVTYLPGEEAYAYDQLLALLLLRGCGAYWEEQPCRIEEIKRAERAIASYVERELCQDLPLGPACCCSHTNKHHFLSETVGLQLWLAVVKKDYPLFMQQLQLVKEGMFSLNAGLIHWRINDELEKIDQGGTPIPEGRFLSSVVGDDLLILRAFLDAQQLWGGFDEEISLFSDALLRGVENASFLPHAVSAQDKEGAQPLPAEYTILSYCDSATLEKLASISPGWEEVLRSTEALFSDERMQNDAGLFWHKYLPKEQRFYGLTWDDDEVLAGACVPHNSTIQMGIVAYHCARSGRQEQALSFLQAMEKEFDQGGA